MRLPKLPEALHRYAPIIVGAVVAALLVGVGVGRLSAPIKDTANPSASGTTGPPSVAPDGHIHGMGSMPGMGGAGTPGVGGQSLSESGYTLVPGRTKVSASPKPRPWTFSIIDAEGKPVTKFTRVHTKLLHLFVVRRDMTGFQHIHPKLDAKTGRWSIDIRFDAPGTWRVIADFAVKTSKGPVGLALGTDVTVPGEYEPRSLPKPSTNDSVDGLKASMEFKPKIGVSEPLLLTVTAHGKPAEIQHYLGAYGHLVMLRQNDLGYAHVHPDTALDDGAIRFWATVPSPGTYRLFIDVKVDGKVSDVQFTVAVR
ncbi:MAG TPA: hypothetical protein VE172_07050 [Stackebrandtia sp.]|uniref:hypothetical protein n=1 Tax=Stackebrandtia sp. TaxID=2023065 RepID=UPI002D59262E|nr:hypothetical protein [Stackebrandtia sp.]HZE38557.1 hypothetical protein [Stackebrandtia sp.]